MTPKQLIKHFGAGNVALAAKQLGVTRACVYNWMKKGRVSGDAQLKAEKKSRGKLRATASRP